MRTLALAVCLALPLAASAEAFDDAAKKAEKLTSLREFLDRYVGSCGHGDKFDKQDCKRNAEAARKKLSGKPYAVTIAEAASSLSLGGCDGEGRCRLHLVPFFDGGGGLALSRGAPKGKDKHGNPILDIVPIFSDDADPDDLGRALRTGMVSLDLVFEPQGVWTMARNGGGEMTGVKAKLVAVRVRSSRSGDTLAEKKL